MDNENESGDDVSKLAEKFEDQVGLASSSRPPRGGKGAAGGGGSRGGRFRGTGAGASNSKGRTVDLSRALSRLLRHQAASAGVELDAQGFASLDKVLQWGPIRSLKPTLAEIVSVVRDSDKQRFALKPKDPDAAADADQELTDAADWLIRANQGHSIKLDSDGLLRPLALPDADGAVPEGSVAVPDTVVHGTYFAFWPRIVESGGLRPMGRNHVHCSTGLPEDAEAGVISGMRRDAEVLVYVDVAASMREADIRWWMSDNGVVLTEGAADESGLVPLRFFREVRGRAQNVGTLWRDGEWVADLPAGVRIRVPQGKNQAGGRGGKR